MHTESALHEFIVRSQTWIHLTRGRDLFRYASQAFTELFHIDSGLFVYQKRLNHLANEAFTVYRPWGKFLEVPDAHPQLGALLISMDSDVKRDCWISCAELPEPLRSRCNGLGLKAVGIWEIRSRGALVGAMFVGRTKVSAIDDSEVIRTCAVQVTMVMDSLLAWRSKDEMNNRYRSLLQHNPDAICAVDKAGHLLDFNPAAQRLTGYSQDEILQLLQSGSLMETAVMTDISAHVQETLGGEPRTFETKILRKDGELISAQMKTVPIITDGQVTGIFGIAKDITESQRVQQALREAEEKYRVLVEKALIGVYIMQRGKFVYVNPHMQSLLGYSPDELYRREGLEFIHPDDRPMVRDVVQRRRLGVGDGGYRARAIRKDGTVIELEGLGTLTEFHGEATVIGTLMDITERMRTEELIRQSDRLAIVGQMAAGVAHEIRNPLTALRGFAQLLGRRAENERYCEIMLSELERINHIVSEFLVISKPQVQDFKKANVEQLIRTVVDLERTQAIMNSVEIGIHVEQSVPDILCNPDQLKQVFLNLLKNAVEAMPSGGHIEVFLSKGNEETIVIRIADEGQGIPEARLSTLGQPFYTTKEKGTGLGLTVSYKIIEAHRGTIRYDSAVGRGTTVEIELPCSFE